MRSTGASVAGAGAGVALAQMTTSLGGRALPCGNGSKVVLALGAGSAVLAFLLAAFLPRHRPADPVAAPAATGAPSAEPVC
ncbi:hypothetical protein ACFQ9Z_01135 [Streptomyces sp. NPDC056580]|uniref:hypothetical protein n=1 Tax=Streptomyces sp. NPDC056580 TaxID=3345872 RepID=UPI0036B9658B